MTLFSLDFDKKRFQRQSSEGQGLTMLGSCSSFSATVWISHLVLFMVVQLNTQPLFFPDTKTAPFTAYICKTMYTQSSCSCCPVSHPPQPLTSGFPGLVFIPWLTWLQSNLLPSPLVWAELTKNCFPPYPCADTHTHTHSSHVSVFGKKRLNQTPLSLSAPTLILLYHIVNSAGHVTGISFRAPDFSPFLFSS